MRKSKVLYRHAIKIKKSLWCDLKKLNITLFQYVKGVLLCNRIIKKYYGMDKGRQKKVS